MTRRFLCALIFAALTGGQLADARPPKEPTYVPARNVLTTGDVSASGTATVGRDRFVLQFVARRLRKPGASPQIVRSEMRVRRGARQVARVALPEGAVVETRWSDIDLAFLQPGRGRGVVVSVRGSDEWLVIVFPAGFSSKGYAQVFHPSSSSIAARTFQWGDDRRGYRTITEEYSERDGDNGETVTYVWKGKGFAAQP